MDIEDVRQRKILLYDFYEKLLTERQREIFSMHFMDDCSLAEVGEVAGITPQAVADLLKRVCNRLEKYEDLLGLVDKAHKITLALDELENTPANIKVSKKIRALWECSIM
ncbi:MAG: hypothetical protein FWF78_04190 [Defluviitaleaceae bacterium]|nr:hypothetical protein [Defluviitaleaceae bacterium]